MSTIRDHGEVAERTLRLLRAMHERGRHPVPASQLQGTTGQGDAALGRETVRRRLYGLAKAQVCCRTVHGWQLAPLTREGHSAINDVVDAVHEATGLAAFAHEPSVAGLRICLAAHLTEDYLAMLAQHLPAYLRWLSVKNRLADRRARVANPADLLADTRLTRDDAPGAVILTDPHRPEAEAYFARAAASVPGWRVISVPLRAFNGFPLTGALSVAGPASDIDARQEEALTALNAAAAPTRRRVLAPAA